MPEPEPSAEAIARAVAVLVQAGAVFTVPPNKSRSLTLAEAGEQLGFSSMWVREHLSLFPNRWRAPGGGRNGGEWRIPLRDVEAFARERRVQR